MKNHSICIKTILEKFDLHEDGKISDQEMCKFVDCHKEENTIELIENIKKAVFLEEEEKKILFVLGGFTSFCNVRLEAIKASREVNGFAFDFVKKLRGLVHLFSSEEDKLIREIFSANLQKVQA